MNATQKERVEDLMAGAVYYATGWSKDGNYLASAGQVAGIEVTRRCCSGTGKTRFWGFAFSPIAEMPRGWHIDPGAGANGAAFRAACRRAGVTPAEYDRHLPTTTSTLAGGVVTTPGVPLDD